MKKNALVVSGGGAKGSFAVGVIEELSKPEHDIKFDICAGTSTGSLIVPLVAINEIELLKYLYTTVRNEDIIIERNPIEILTKDAIYDTRPLWSLINSFINQERYQRILDSSVELYLTTVNLQNGEITYWNQHNSGPDGDPLDRRTFMRAVMASASMPVLMPPFKVIKDGDQHVDGGVRELAPLKIAIDHGATDIYAIVLDPEKYERQEEEFVSVVKQLLRTIDLLAREVTANDVARAVLYNKAIRYITQLRDKAKALLSADQVKQLFEDSENPYPFEGKRLMNLYVIRPAEELPMDALEFSPVAMSQVMELGGQAAREALEKGPLPIT